MEYSVTCLPNEIIETIINLLDGYDLFMFSMVCQRFKTLSLTEESWMKAYRLSFPKTYSAMLQPPFPEYWSFSKPANRIFLYLACQEKNRRTLEGNLEENSNLEIDIVSSIFTKQKKSKSLLLVVCYVIRRLTYTPPGCMSDYRKEMADNRKLFGERDIVNPLIKILSDDYEYPELVAAVLCALNNIACDVEINCKTIVKEGGISWILKSMKKYSQTITVLDYGSSALANITREAPDEQSLKDIMTDGVVLAQILFQTKNVPASNVVSGLDLLTVLARRKYEFRKDFGKTALELVHHLLTRFRNETNLISGCCRTIHEFCRSSDTNRDLAIKFKLTSLLLDKLSEYPDSTLAYSIIFALCFILWKKTREEQENFKRFVTLAISHFQGLVDPRFQLGVAIILGNFATQDSEHRSYIKSFNISRQLAESIRKHAKKPENYTEIIELFEK